MSPTLASSSSAQEQLRPEPPSGGQTAHSLQAAGIVLSAILLLALLLLAATYLFHKLPKKKHGHGVGRSGRRRRRRKHRKHRNTPTLAQTGGLPPKRSDDKPHLDSSS